MDEGNFKKGKINPIVALVLVLLVGGGAAAFVALGTGSDADRLAPDKAEDTAQSILKLPQEEQLAKWREYAKGGKSSYLQEKALKYLAFAKDPAGIQLSTLALTDPAQKLRAQAALALAWYGSPEADRAKPALLKALEEAGEESRPQIAWTLVELNERAALPKILELYKAGHLAQVKRLDGIRAFDPDKLVKMVSLDELAAWHTDPSPAVRQLVAVVLSRTADPKYTDQLIALVQDADQEVARQAAPGLGKIGDERARQPLIEKLRGGDVDQRVAYLQALRDGIGTRGLVMGLDVIDEPDPTKRWHQFQQVFKMIRDLADPHGGDALTAFIDTKPHIHWQVQAAMGLAEIGDLRALPTLARRLRMDAEKIYSDETDYEMLLKRNNNERVEAARMIADLAVIHPDKKKEIEQETADALIFWIHELPSPHANGLRALAAMDSKKDIQALRDWANPKVGLPLEGQQPPMPEEWVIAQSALRYAGWMKDQASWGVLENQLTRRSPNLDATMDGLMGGGVAILGMTLRAIGVGASHGFAEWGDRRAFQPLMKYIEEPKENEQSRLAACTALAWVANDDDMVEVAKKIEKYGTADVADQVRRSCLLETLITRPIPNTSTALITLLNQNSSLQVRHQVARAIGKAGLTPELEAQLFEMMKNETLVNDAALALMLGGSPETAARAVASLSEQKKEVIEELQELWYNTFGYWSQEDLEQGHIFRYVDNAVAASRVEFKDTPQAWVSVQLNRQFENLLYDNGPKSFTRVVLRNRLREMAMGDDAQKRAGAIRTLHFMKERGVLLSLRDAEGETGQLARAAYFELLNPSTDGFESVRKIEVPEK